MIKKIRISQTTKGFNKGRPCKQCGGKEILKSKNDEIIFLTKSQVENYKKVKSHCKKLKGDCLSEYYVSEKDPLRLLCSSGHSWSAIWSNVKRSSWCPKCSARKRGKSSVIDVTELVSKKGGKYLGDFKKNNRVYRSILCKNGHKFEILTSNLTRGKWCGDCYHARRQG